MAYHPPRPEHALDRWLRRLDQAAGRMNPFLLILAIGLMVLNLVCLAALAPHLQITRQPEGIDAPAVLSAAPPAAAVAETRQATSY